MYYITVLIVIIMYGGMVDCDGKEKEGESKTPPLKPARGCKANPMDIALVIDGTLSVGATNFKKMLDFSARVLDNFKISRNWTQVGLVTIDVPQIVFTLSESRSNNYVTARLEGTSIHPFGSRKTAAALEMARELLFSKEKGARDGVMKVLILIVGGKASDKAQLKNVSQQLLQDNIKVLVVTVGENFNEYQTIVGGNDKHLLPVKNYDGLENIKATLLDRACAVCSTWMNKPAVEIIDNKCVMFVNRRKPWHKAKHFCEAKGSNVRLLELTSEALRDYVAAQIKTGKTKTWLGGTDDGHENKWVWAGSNETIAVDRSWWGKAQPDNRQGNENCLLMRSDEKLYDHTCKTTLAFYCERPIF